MDVFERMPHLIVALSPRDVRLIDVASRTDQPPPQVKILHLAAYVDPPTSEDIQDLYADLWTDPRFELVEIEVIILTPPAALRDEIIRRLRSSGYDDVTVVDDDEAPIKPVKYLH